MTGSRTKFYNQIYYNLCSTNVNNKIQWDQKYSGFHRHHIIPKHSGGTDDESNFTYLSVRHHIIAHFLLWKMNKDANDLRAMYMLGAKLSSSQRVKIGKWCYENKIGMFNPDYDDVRKEWICRGISTQIENKIGIHNPENFQKHASLGGKASIVSPNNPWSYWASKEGRLKRASLGGKSHIGKIWIHKDGIITRCKFEEFSKVIQDGWLYGMKDGGKEYVNDGKKTFRVPTEYVYSLTRRGWKIGKDQHYLPDRKRSKKDLSYQALLEYEYQGEHIPPK